MKKRQLAGLCLLAACSLGTRAEEGLYLGASVGVMDADVSGFDEATNAGVLIGYDVLTIDIFSLAIEGELTTTVSDGDVEANGVGGDWDIDTQAAYLAAKMGNDFYIKVRFGVIREDVSVSIADSSFSGNDTGGSWSGALGYMFNKNWGAQIEGTMVESDVNYWNAGVRYQFN